MTEKNRAHKTWTVREDNALVTGIAAGKTQEEVGKELGRTVPSVRNRLSYLRLRAAAIPHPRRALPGPVPTTTHVVTPDEIEDEGLELFLWFMRHAWQEGIAVTIPVLGTTFQNVKK